MSDYKDTVYLPKTDFSMRAGLPTKEPQILKLWEEINLFKKLREQRKNSEPFFGMINLIITHESGIFRGKMNSVGAQSIKLMQQTRQMLYKAPVKPENVVVPPFLPDTSEVRKDIARAYNNIYILDIEVKEIIGKPELSLNKTNIEFKNVEFKYQSTDQKAVKNINKLTIKEKIEIIEKSKKNKDKKK